MTTNTDGAMPELPEPTYIYHTSDEEGGDDLFEFAHSGAVDIDEHYEGGVCSDCVRLYTADQMREYARAATTASFTTGTSPAMDHFPRQGLKYRESTVSNLEKLEQSLVRAALELAGASMSHGFSIPVPNTTPRLFVSLSESAIQQAAGAVPEGVADLLRSCRGSVKADLMRYEQMILSRPSPEYVAAYEQECDRLQALLDSIDALAASPSPLGREAAYVSQNAESEPQTILTFITDPQTLATPAPDQATPLQPQDGKDARTDSVHLDSGASGGVHAPGPDVIERMSTEHIREDRTVEGWFVETHYTPCKGVMDADGYMRVLVDEEGYDTETRILHATLNSIGWFQASEKPPAGKAGGDGGGV